MMGLLNSVKRAAVSAENAEVPMVFLFGTVVKASPLTVKVDDRFEISGEMLTVMKEFREGYYPTHRHTGFDNHPATEAASGGTGEAAFAPHVHQLKSGYTTNSDAASEYYYGLDAGDRVVLLRNRGGQQFLVIGRI